MLIVTYVEKIYVTFLQSKNDESLALLFSSKDSLIESSCSVRLQTYDEVIVGPID